MHDLVIRGGLVVDGTGSPGVVRDVAVEGDLIVEVGTDLGRGRREIDAAGLVVSPGWVDIHTHYDGQVTWDPVVAPSSVNGVTSIAMGNCGVGFAPAATDRHDWLIGLLEGVEDIPGTALAEGLPWDWESFPEYLDAVDRRPHAVDIGAHVPHAALRAYVMGDRGADHTAVPTTAEVAAMRRLVGEALDAGALGFATSRTAIHRTGAGEFVGTMTASAEELIGIAGALTASGRGVVQLVSDLYLTEDDELAEREIALLRRIAREVRRPMSFTVEQVDAVSTRWRTMLDVIDGLCAEGLDVKGQVAPRPIGLLLGLSGSTNPFVATPSYRRIASLPLGERVAALGEPAMRERILAEHSQRVPPGLAGFVLTGFERMFPLGDPPDYEPTADRSVAAMAARAGQDATSFAYDLLLANGGRDLLYMPLNNYAAGNLDEVREMMTAPNVVFGLSDGGAHCNFICDASFPTTAVAHWCRDRSRGEHLPLEHVVHHQTQRPARHVGWRDRGVVAPGYLADVLAFDLSTLQLRPPRLVADLPAGGTRLLQEADGYRWTVKSGIVTFEDGTWTGETPGRVVRGERPSPSEATAGVAS
ncbi:MAG: amidohydrolase family protein [Actinobacteria bacterium]|nr:amidohydrolase family protein [Actinomycetota bacterium]